MSLHRRAAKRDENEAAIVDVLRKRGFAVDFISAAGFPDLVVSKHGAAWFVEVKQPKGKFKPAQIAWRERWQGPPPVTLRSVEDAIKFPEGAQ